jgi:hypothetical protein
VLADEVSINIFCPASFGESWITDYATQLSIARSKETYKKGEKRQDLSFSIPHTQTLYLF